MKSNSGEESFACLPNASTVPEAVVISARRKSGRLRRTVLGVMAANRFQVSSHLLSSAKKISHYSFCRRANVHGRLKIVYFFFTLAESWFAELLCCWCSQKLLASYSSPAASPLASGRSTVAKYSPDLASLANFGNSVNSLNGAEEEPAERPPASICSLGTPILSTIHERVQEENKFLFHAFALCLPSVDMGKEQSLVCIKAPPFIWNVTLGSWPNSLPFGTLWVVNR